MHTHADVLLLRRGDLPAGRRREGDPATRDLGVIIPDDAKEAAAAGTVLLQTPNPKPNQNPNPTW